MSAFTPKMDEAYHRYANLQLRRHRLLVGGHENEPEADAAEDQMAALWPSFDEPQRKSLNGMNSDLAWVRDGGELPPMGRRKEDITAQDRSRLSTARALDEWHEFLHYLRICAALLPTNDLAVFRGAAYGSIALYDYATVFYEMAYGFAPANGAVGPLRSDPARVLQRALTVIESPSDFPTDAVALSAALVMRNQQEQGQTIDRGRFSRLIRNAVSRLEDEQQQPAIRARTFQYASAGYELLNETDRALDSLNEGLLANPSNEAMLIGKGLLLYGTNDAESTAVLAKASEIGAERAVPTILLPLHQMNDREFERLLRPVGTDLIMELTLEQGGGRETQVQPPKAVWRRYFGIDEDDLPLALTLVNRGKTPPETEANRTVSMKSHVMTVEIKGAALPRPAILRMRRVGINRYDYWVYHQATEAAEYGHYDYLLANTPNPHRSHGRRWLVF